MAIQHIATNEPNQGLTFKDSALAHQYLDGLTGVELGAAAHNPFHLEGSINICPEDDFEFYKEEQIKLCGSYAAHDLWGEADDIPLPAHSQDYILSSHVIEHLPDPIGAFLEWSQLLKPDGIIFMIFPKRDALARDKTRPISANSQFMLAHENWWSADTAPDEGVPGGRRGHYWVFTLESMLNLIGMACMVYGLDWKFVESFETDDKVGNGHCAIFRYSPQVST